MSGHTPGPWAVRLHGGNSANGAAAVSGDLVVARVPRAADRPYDQKEADVRLIAAAPDLLAALKECVGWLDPTDTRLVNKGECQADLNQASAALAKAEGV